MQGGFLLDGSQFGQIHSRQFGGVRRIFQEHLAGIDKRLNARFHRQSQERADFENVGIHGIQTGMLLHDPPLRID